MTTAAQARQFAQPFLDRHPDFAFKDRTIFEFPIRHFRRGFRFDRLSSADEFRTSWHVGLMFGPPPKSLGGVGKFLLYASGSVDDPAFADKFLADLERTHAEIFPQLETFEGLLEYQWEPFLGTPNNPLTKSMLLALLGRLGESEGWLRDWIRSERVYLDWNAGRIAQYYRKGSKRWSREQEGHDRVVARLVHFERLHSLLVAGRQEPVVGLFHEWEEINVRNHGLERYWEPSPFPCELE